MASLRGRLRGTFDHRQVVGTGPLETARSRARTRWHPRVSGAGGDDRALRSDRFNLGLIVGLDAFFVLSGFLITTMLLDEWFRNGSINLRHFYVRRGLRLLPGLYAMLTLVVIAGASGLWSFKRAVAEAGAAALYVYPAALARGGASEAILTPLWSLSIEEWFYFSLPPLLTILILRKHSVPRLRVMLWTFGSLYTLGAVREDAGRQPLTERPGDHPIPTRSADARIARSVRPAVGAPEPDATASGCSVGSRGLGSPV